jgi:hypothetical protein
MARYDFTFEKAANYTFAVQYACDGSRPCYIYWYLDGSPERYVATQ